MMEYCTIKDFYLETSRLIIRHFKDGDEAACFSFLSDQETCMADGGYTPYRSMSDERYQNLMLMFKHRKSRYMLELKATHQVIGTINLSEDKKRAVTSYEVGYVVAPAFRRKGYTYEALQAIITACFEKTDTQMLSATTYDFNIASKQLLLKSGFREEGMIHRHLFHPEKGLIDLCCFYLEKSWVSGVNLHEIISCQ